MSERDERYTRGNGRGRERDDQLHDRRGYRWDERGRTVPASVRRELARRGHEADPSVRPEVGTRREAVSRAEPSTRREAASRRESSTRRDPALDPGRYAAARAERRRVDQPREARRVRLPRFDPEAFGRWSEAIARHMGTAQFIVYMTIVIVVWFGWNTLAPRGWQFDPYTFTFLTLVLSLQASYAAPLILLAQNRQAERDRIALEEDRRRATMQKADTEYLAREIASLRIALGEVATRDFLRSELNRLIDDLGEAAERRTKLERKEQRRQSRRAAELHETDQNDNSPVRAENGEAGSARDPAGSHTESSAGSPKENGSGRRASSYQTGPERAGSDNPGPEHSGSEQNRSEHSSSGQNRSEHSSSGQNRSKHSSSEQNGSEQNGSERGDDEHGSEQVGPEQKDPSTPGKASSNGSGKKERRAPQGARRATPMS